MNHDLAASRDCLAQPRPVKIAPRDWPLPGFRIVLRMGCEAELDPAPLVLDSSPVDN